jgi:aspartate aminotransferase
MSKILIDSTLNSGISEMFNLANKIGGDLIRFETGGVDLPTPERIIKSASDAMFIGETNYAPYKGIDSLRESIIKKLELKNKISKNIDDILVTAGGSEALFLTFQALFEKGDEIIISDPSWPHFVEMIKFSGGVAVPAQFISRDGQKVDLDIVERLITTKTRAILINSPHNPTGAVLSKKDLERVVEIAEKYKLIIISDEVYEDFVYGSNKHISIGSLYDNVISIYSLSKTYAMCGWRLGYVAANPELVDRMTKLHMYSITCIPRFIQTAGKAALDGDQSDVRNMVKIYESRRNLLVNRLNGIDNINCPMPKGALYAWPDISKYGNSKEIAIKLLQKAGCVTVPGSAFGAGGEGRLRLAMSLSEEEINKGIDKIQESISDI